MLYREVGQYKSNYAADMAVFPILQDRIGVAVILFIAFVVFPLAGNEFVLNTIMIPFLIFALAAIGLNLLTGYTGLVSLAYAGIAGISAYGSVGLTMRFGWSFWLAMPVAAVGAAIVGVLLGLPSLRLKGFYFALSSLVIQTVLSLGFVYFVNLTNGDTGISQIPPPEIPFTGQSFHGTGFDLLLTVAAWLSVPVTWTCASRAACRRPASDAVSAVRRRSLPASSVPRVVMLAASRARSPPACVVPDWSMLAAWIVRPPSA